MKQALIDGQKLIGVRELAKLAKVSVGTVDRALNGRSDISSKTRDRILRLAKRHGYEPNPTARALSKARTSVRIGVCIPREIRFFYDQVRDGIMDEARRFGHLGLEIAYMPVPRLGFREVPVIKRALRENINALIVTPGNPALLAPIIDEAETHGNVRVACVASDDSLSRRSVAISVEPTLNGRLAGELLANFVAPGSKAAVVTGSLCTEDHKRKTEGFSSVFPSGCPGGQVVQVIEGQEDEKKTYAECVLLLKKYPDLASIYVTTVNCLPVCRALDHEGRAGKVRLVATDLFAEVAPWFQNRTISASIHQRPYQQGQTAVRLLAEHLIYGQPLPSVHYLAPSVVLRNNLHLFREMAMPAALAVAAVSRTPIQP